MVRTASGVFLAIFESALLTIAAVGSFSFISNTLPSDNTALSSWTYILQALFLAVTVLVMLLIGALEKQDDVTTAPSSTVVVEKLAKLAEGLLADDISDFERSSIVERMQAIVRPGTGRYLSYRYLMNAANAYCGGVFLLLFVYLTFALQGSIFSDMLSSDSETRVGVTNTTVAYVSSERLDWVQVAFGQSGWERMGITTNPYVFTANPDNTPLLGSALLGAIMAYLVLALLLSMYSAYSATPSGVGATLFLDPKVFTLANGIIMFGTREIVQKVFAKCESPWLHIWGVLAFSVIVCFDEYLIMGILWSVEFALDEPELELITNFWVDSVIRPTWIAVIAFIPLVVGALLGDITVFLIIVSLVLAALSTLIALLHYLSEVLPRVRSKNTIQQPVPIDPIIKVQDSPPYSDPDAEPASGMPSLFSLGPQHQGAKLGRYKA